MNPAAGRGRGRFIRGRARGGGSHRPYFYFRRNGRVIPANGNHLSGQREPAPTPPPKTKPQGWGKSKQPPLDCSFLRPENYVAPEDGLQVQSILVDNPRAYPGWRLYFLRDSYAEDNDLAKRIVAVEAHYQRNPKQYDFVRIRQRGCFPLPASGIVDDEQLNREWPSMVEDFCAHPLRTLSTWALAMHTVVINHALDVSESKEASNVPETGTPPLEECWQPSITRTRKIYVRPVDFQAVELVGNVSHERVDTSYTIRGIVKSVGEPTYSMTWQSFRCSRCQAEQALRQRGSYAPHPYNCKKTPCAAKDNFLALRSSPYTRLSVRQIIRVEESSLSLVKDFEHTPRGELDVELRHDLVDAVHVGQEIVIAGVVKLRELSVDSELPTTSTRAGGGDGASYLMQAYLKAISVQDARLVKREFGDRDLAAIATINVQPNNFKLLVQSLAPEIHGHELPKAACLLSLLSGVDEGPLNVLLVGDPGIGKSSILQSCAQVAERGYHISGKRGAQTAQKMGVTFTGRNKRVMQAGALISANSSGHCTMDDVDKLASKQTLLLQSMQSGEMNMPIPGIFGCFSAQPSIIACANPQRGQYNQAQYLLQNIRIVPALLKEFHLVYVLLDKPSATRDVSLSTHVRLLHAGSKKRAKIAARFALKPKLSQTVCETTFAEGQPKTESDDSIMQQDYDLDKRLEMQQGESELDLLPPILIKKFLTYARNNIKPLLNEEASKSIIQFFLELRERSAAEYGQSQIGVG